MLCRRDTEGCSNHRVFEDSLPMVNTPWSKGNSEPLIGPEIATNRGRMGGNLDAVYETYPIGCCQLIRSDNSSAFFRSFAPSTKHLNRALSVSCLHIRASLKRWKPESIIPMRKGRWL